MDSQQQEPNLCATYELSYTVGATLQAHLVYVIDEGNVYGIWGGLVPENL